MAANREKLVLTVENVISVIKGYDERKRSKICAADLIELIIQLPDTINISKENSEVNSEVTFNFGK